MSVFGVGNGIIVFFVFGGVIGFSDLDFNIISSIFGVG